MVFIFMTAQSTSENNYIESKFYIYGLLPPLFEQGEEAHKFSVYVFRWSMISHITVLGFSNKSNDIVD
jgi:hypothetical protein